MGLDLTIVPYEWYRPGDWSGCLAYTRIACGGAGGFSERLEKSGLKPRPLPDGARFSWYGDGGLEDRTDDPYGQRLTYLRAEELLLLDPPQNKRGPCAWAYLKALPPETPVILWWH